jgi:vacuolar-type H+-ATPase subunit I/STV1
VVRRDEDGRLWVLVSDEEDGVIADAWVPADEVDADTAELGEMERQHTAMEIVDEA